jgi:hypothetical protein
MKLIDHFTSFLHDTVNLNATRLTQLETSVGAIKDFIRASDWSPKMHTFEEQGSWAHKTIIKPVDGGEFDADLLVIVKPVEGWSAKEYLSTLKKVFSDSATYKDKVTRYSHCVTIEYAGERKVDIAPCVRDRGGITGYEVCNFGNDAFERSEPRKYTDWLRDRNSWTGGNGLKKVTRLFKYLRDIKGTFTCPSVLLTTLLGMQITSLDALSSDPFADVPTALKTIAGRLDDWLQARPTRPLVPNPVLPSEDFSHLWDTDEKYENFRESIERYRDWIDEAYDEEDTDESVSKWRRVFGDAFAPGVVLDKSASVMEGARKLALAIVRASSNLVLDVRDDLVGLVSTFGPTVVPPEFTRLVYKQQPTWRRTRHGGFDVKAIATLHASKETSKIRDVASGQGPLPKGHYLRFDVRESGGTMFPIDKYRVHWRITNTDREAVNAQCLRGGFEEADDGTARWEHLKFRGVHMGEAFVVRRKDKMLVGQSDPFFVVIE